MPIPENISKNDILQAIAKIDKEGIPYDADSQYYDLIYKEKRYPPKVVLSYANIFANGVELDRATFEGGRNKKSFKLLETLGFNIVDKGKESVTPDRYPHFKMFFDQVASENMHTGHFQREFKDLTVKIGFGQGVPTFVPWIAFLAPGHNVKKGIYPGILFYKKLNLLLVNYCVSATNPPPVNWQVTGVDTVEDYFSKNGLGMPPKYKESLVYKAYKTDKGIDIDSIADDINYLINVYKTQLSMPSTAPAIIPPVITTTKVDEDGNNKKGKSTKFDPSDFIKDAYNANLKLDRNVALRFVASLLTKPFVILTGLSGSGKTKMALAFAQWLSQGVNGNGSSEQYCLVPVGADWTNREPLLGFPNALDSKDYVLPDNGALELIIRAIANPDKPFFLILDEMNLSHVERYFADFLSAMESKCYISLHSGEVTKMVESEPLPAQILLPANLFIIGTVNIDETTYMFSPKVLDRASVIEFRVTFEEMEAFLNDFALLNMDYLKSKGAHLGFDFVRIAADEVLSDGIDFMSNNLLQFFKVLKNNGAEFGYRSASEIIKYASVVRKLDIAWTDDSIFDTTIVQKLLPKVHGSRRKLEADLVLMAKLCLQEGALFEEMVKRYHTDRSIDYSMVKYPLAFEKIMRMYKNLLSNSFTSFAEA